MVTYKADPKCRPDGTFEFEFEGKSTDTKPVKVHKNMPIANGASFMTLDTAKYFKYDAESEQWNAWG